MAQSEHEHDILAGLEMDLSANSPRLARRLGPGGHPRLVQRAERGAKALGWTLIVCGVLLLIGFAGASGVAGTSVALFAVGFGCVNAPRVARLIAGEAKRRAQPESP